MHHLPETDRPRRGQGQGHEGGDSPLSLRVKEPRQARHCLLRGDAAREVSGERESHIRTRYKFSGKTLGTRVNSQAYRKLEASTFYTHIFSPFRFGLHTEDAAFSDLLLCAGTSLEVYPFAGVADAVPMPVRLELCHVISRCLGFVDHKLESW